MFDLIKTSNGAYYLTLTVAVLVWFFGGIGVFAGYHLNRLRGIEANEKAVAAKDSEDSIRAEAAELRNKLESTTKELEETKVKTLTHDDILSYRTVTPAQRQAFIDATRELPKGRLFVIAAKGGADTYQYAEAINEMLSAAGYEPTSRPSTVDSFGEPIIGITAGIESEENKPVFAEPLILALQGAGFPVQPIIVSGAASRGLEYVHITVGSKGR